MNSWSNPRRTICSEEAIYKIGANESSAKINQQKDRFNRPAPAIRKNYSHSFAVSKTL
jgi:D-serine dehydratase